MCDIQVSGAGNDAAQSWLHDLVLTRLRAMPEVCLDELLQAHSSSGCGPSETPSKRLRLVLTAKAVHLQVASGTSSGPQFDAYMPLLSLTAQNSGRAVAHRIDEALGEALQATLAMQAADAGGPELLRRAAAGDVQAAPRQLSAAGHLALQAFAVRRVSERRDVAAAPILRDLVTAAADGDASAATRALGLQAVGSAMALCDRQAVLPMVALAQHQAPEFVVQLAHAIGQVGGPMAEAYLVTLASGHLDGQVRLGAATALGALQLRRRAGTGCEGRGS